MRVLLDNNIHSRFGVLLTGHDVYHAQELGWERLKNGDLIAAAEAESFEVIVTADEGMRYKQSLQGRTIAVVVLETISLKWEFVALSAPQVLKVLRGRQIEGSFVIVQLP